MGKQRKRTTRRAYLKRWSAETINVGRTFDPNKVALYDCFSKKLTKCAEEVPPRRGLQTRSVDQHPRPMLGVIAAKHRHWAMESIAPVSEWNKFVLIESNELYILRLYFQQNRFAFVKLYSTLRMESYEYSSREDAFTAHSKGNISWHKTQELPPP